MHDRFFGLTLACLLATSCAPHGPRTSEERVASRSDAIIAGRESGAEQDAVVLLFQSARNQTCTGTMVAPNLVVTARHCVADTGDDGIVTDFEASDLRVFVGVDALSALRADDSKPATRGKELVVPRSRTLYPDVAYVVLEDSLSTPIAALRLARGVAVGETVGVIGYGLDETGKRPDKRMQRGGLVVSQIGPGRSPIGERIERGELVFGEAACSGDSGGPAFSEETGALVAIASRVGNGTAPTAADPAAFCIGESADDVYTDFGPAADVTTRAFAAAGASPLLEDSVAPAKEGELASANLTTGGEATRVSGGEATSSGGCSAAPARESFAASMSLASPIAILLGVSIAVRVMLGRRRPVRR